MRWLMGTFWEIETPGIPASDAVSAAFAEIRRLDDLLSHYKPESELSRLNAHGQAVVPQELADLIGRCLAYSAESQGAFDITVAPLVELWGFKDMAPRVPSPSDLALARQTVGWQRVSVSGNGVRMAPGTRLEFGAIGKGYALDRAMAVLTRAGIARARIDAGGQQLVRGTWTIGILHPRCDGLLGSVTVTNQSVATSGDTERFFIHDGIRYNHHIDPRTGWPSTDFASVTIVAPDAEAADALGTLSTVAGPEAARPIVAAHHAEALWYGADGRVRTTPGFRWQPESPGPKGDPGTTRGQQVD